MSLSEPGSIETGRFIAHPWYCDANGHLNTRFYQGFFDDATQHLLAHCGHRQWVDGISVADVRCTMNYQAEVEPGAPVLVVSGFEALGDKSFTTWHEMLSVDGERLFATCETVSVFIHVGARESVAMTEDFRARANDLLRPKSGAA